MVKKISKGVLVLIMIAGISFSFFTVTAKKSEAKMVDYLLDFFTIPGGYCYVCYPGGNGCHIVTPDE